MRENPITWGEVITYVDRLAFGMAPDGHTVCLGQETDTKEAVTIGNLSSNDPIVNEIIKLEHELKREKEANYGFTIRAKIRTKRQNPHNKRPAITQRTRPVFSAKSHGTRVRQPSQNKALPLPENIQSG